MSKNNKRQDEQELIATIPNHKRYYFTTQWVFPNAKFIVSAFPRENFDHGFHVQFFYEIVVITRGEGYHFIGDETVHAGVGDVFIIPPGVRHAFLCKEGGMDVFHFHFSPAFTKKYIPVLKDYPNFFTLFELAEMEDTVSSETKLKYKYIYLPNKELEYMQTQLNDVATFPYSYKTNYVIESKAVSLIALLCYHYSDVSAEGNVGTSVDTPFQRSVLYAIENCTSDITVAELAKMASLSETGYIRRFKQTVGTTPYRFIIKQRLEISKRLLRRTDKTVAAIAEETGFYDVSHFVKAFFAEYGITPGEYRQNET